MWRLYIICCKLHGKEEQEHNKELNLGKSPSRVREKIELGSYYSFIRGCSRVRIADDLNFLIRTNLRRIMPHEMAAYGIVKLSHPSQTDFINVDFPEDYFRLIHDTGVLSNVIRAWLERCEPNFCTMDEEGKPCGTSEWASVAYGSGIHNMAWHGVLDLASPFATFFAFAQLRYDSVVDIRHCLHMVVPHLHAAISNVLSNFIAGGSHNSIVDPQLRGPDRSCPTMDGTRRLSAREAEVLVWLYHGKTNSEIAKVLNTSRFTVKNHVQNILVKLSANNRTHAVSQAIRSGLLPADMPKSSETTSSGTRRKDGYDKT